MNCLILNDIHIGVQRKAGTTIKSQDALREYLFTAFASILTDTVETELLINGDLFDTFEVSPQDWMRTYVILCTWLSQGKVIYLVAGNHDWSPKGSRMSSFEMLTKVLLIQFPTLTKVVNIDETMRVGNVVLVAHFSNQDMFDQGLEKVLNETTSGDYVFLHANYDNKFAAESDHSLNVSEAVAAELVNKGAALVFAHEHQARRLKPAGTLVHDGVIVMGNQWPTSVADCKGNDAKFAHVLRDGVLERFETWNRNAQAGYVDVAWYELVGSLLTSDVRFIRVSGEATRAQAADVINTIAKYRTVSDAFVITNAVRVDGLVEIEALPETFEAAKAFDVMEFIRGQMTAEEMVVVDSLAKEAA